MAWGGGRSILSSSLPLLVGLLEPGPIDLDPFPRVAWIFGMPTLREWLCYGDLLGVLGRGHLNDLLIIILKRRRAVFDLKMPEI